MRSTGRRGEEGGERARASRIRPKNKPKQRASHHCGGSRPYITALVYRVICSSSELSCRKEGNIVVNPRSRAVIASLMETRQPTHCS